MNHTNIQVHLGNLRYVPFRLRKAGLQAFWNVSAAQRISVEYKRVDEDTPLTPVECSRYAPTADWIAGLAPCLISPADITARTGTYAYTVTVFDGVLEMTAGAGRIEVLPRPVTDMPTPGGGSWNSTALQTGVNASGVLIPAGAPVSRVATGVVLAAGGPVYAQAHGISVAPCAPGALCLYIPTGTVRLPDWSLVFGSATLPPGTTIYLDHLTGRLTTDVPDVPLWGVRQIVGNTDDNIQTLHVSLDYGIVL